VSAVWKKLARIWWTPGDIFSSKPNSKKSDITYLGMAQH